VFVEGLRYKSGGIFFGESSGCVWMKRAVFGAEKGSGGGGKVNKGGFVVGKV
jgi:hypothetical protein